MLQQQAAETCRVGTFYLTECEADTHRPSRSSAFFLVPPSQSRAARLGRIGGTFDPSPVRSRVSLAFEASSDARASAVRAQESLRRGPQVQGSNLSLVFDTKPSPGVSVAPWFVEASLPDIANPRLIHALGLPE